MFHPNYRRPIQHSAKGSTWEDHKYVKRIDGTYYYPSGYDKGRTIDSLKDNSSNSEKSEGNDDAELSSEDVENLALEVIRGNFGNGQVRKDLLGGNYQKIQDRVNELMRAMKVSSISMSSTSESTVKSGEDAMKKAVKKVEKTVAEKGIDFQQTQSVYRKQKTQGR